MPSLGVAWFRSPAAVALAAATALLFGCDQRPYPAPTQDPAPSTPPAELMGAPAPPPTNQTTAAQPETPAVADTPPPTPDPLRAPDVSMAPIPNPPAGPSRRVQSDLPPRPAPVVESAKTAADHISAPKPAPARQSPRPAAQPEQLAGAALEGAPVGKYGDHGPKLEAFLAEARKALHHGSQLRTPAKAESGQKANVALVLPASFSQAIRKAAEANGLISAGAPLNVTAALTAPGFKVEPTDPQLQPLQSGQPTEFHWSLTPEEQATKGAMKAAVCVEAPAGAEPICLGDVGPARPGLHVNSQVLGVALLIVIISLVIAWLARGRRTPPSRSAAARRAARAAALDDAAPYSS